MKLVTLAALVAMTLGAVAQPALAATKHSKRTVHTTKHTAANPATTEDGGSDPKVAAAPPAPISLATVIVAPASLPVGQVLDLRRDARPSELSASAKIAGMKVEIHDMNNGRPTKNRGGQHYVEIRNDVETDSPDFDASEQQTCYEVARTVSRRTAQIRKSAAKERVPAEPDEEAEHWTNSLSWQVTMMRQQPQAGQPAEDDRVQLVHAEAFQAVAGGAGSELVTRDIWVDATTGGARLQHEAHLPLRDLGPTLPGVHLYAGKTDSRIIYVATHDKNIESLFVSEPDGNVNSGNCGHMSLAVETTQGYSALSQYIVRTSRRVPVKTLIPSTDENPTADGKPQESDSEDVLQRTGHISVSTQWEAEEKEPLLAYSAGWDTREHTQN